MKPEFDVAQTPLERGTTLIEASAGTGKTYAIAGIFLRLVVEHGLAVGEILVTTYTVPATAELRDRIRQLLHFAVQDWPRGTSEHELIAALIAAQRVEPEIAQRRLEMALRGFDEASIQTIHGICQRVLQDRAFESRLPFDLELITDTSPLLQELAEDYWRTHFYHASAPVVAAVLTRKISPASLAQLLGRTIQHPTLQIRPELAVDNLREAVESEFTEFQIAWAGSRDEVSAQFATAQTWAKPKSGWIDQLEERLASLDLLATDRSAPIDAHTTLEAFSTRQLFDDARASQVPPTHPFFDLCERLMRIRDRFAVATKAHFLQWARAELPRRKMQRQVVAFDDLLTQLHEALQPPGGERLAGLLRRQFRATLIDEFQDTDPLQDAIFRSVFASQEHWLFLIGDPKQAIYGFRGADVFSYLAAARSADRQFRLGVNQRSSTNLVRAVNAVFSRGPEPFVESGIEFAPVEAAGRLDETPLLATGASRPPFRFWLAPDGEPLTAGHANERLPRATAAEASRMLAGGLTIGGGRIKPSDLAVLTMSNRQAQATQAAFAALDIPSVLLSNGNVFRSPEAADLQILLAAIAEPTRDNLIRSALATSLLALEAAAIDALTDAEREWETWLLRFQKWNARWRETGFIQMFRPLLRDCGVPARLLAAVGGDRALTNLLHLSELIHHAAVEQRLAPNGLLHWLAVQRSGEAPGSEENELRLERDEDAVQIITIHKSKGLEFNIVICPFAWGSAEPRKTKEPLYHGADSQPVLDLGSDNLGASATAAAREHLAEHTRLLYVALTRARYECHFIWGRYYGSEASAAMWVLHPPEPPVTDPVAALHAHGKALTPAQLESEIAALAEAHPLSIAAAPLPDLQAAVFRPDGDSELPLAARIFSGNIDRRWRISSFSSLTEHRDSDLPDYDQTPVPEAVDTGLVPQGIHAFPAGKRAGVFLHRVFEKLDFTQPETIPALVSTELSFSGFDAAEWSETLSENIRRTLEAELLPGLRLRDVPPSSRLIELEFHFPVAHLEADAVSKLLTSDTVGRLSFEPRNGMLKGFIDLVFEGQGRFYIVDWKSNRLGDSTEAYSAPALRAEMVRHHYGLQYHLYTVALRRYLRLRLGPNYDDAKHLGGIFYIFLRGIDPKRPELGIFHDRPALAAEFDTLLASTP